MANIKCIDVSTWQGNIDWTKVKAAGYGHAIIRAGFGRETSQVDNKFEQNYKNAKAAGVKLGVYWYSYAVDKADAIKEAKACLQVIKGKSFEMPVFFDMEESSMTKLGKATLTAMAKTFCDTVIEGGFRAGVYSNPNWFKNYLNYTELKKSYPIWLAQYHTEAQYECDIWQYSSTGTVSGISGNVDMNVIYNSDIVKPTATETASTASTTATNYQGAGIQALLLTAKELGLITQNITPIDNKVGSMTKAAILQMKKYLGMSEEYSITLEFIQKMQEAIADKIARADLVRSQLDVGQTGLDILCLKALLLVAHDLGLCSRRMTPGSDYAGPGMATAIKECQKTIGIDETGVADSDFVNKLYQEILTSYPIAGDINGDGKVDVKDVTALQKHLAGIE